MFTQSNNGLLSICWSKRPGVHMITLHWSILFFSKCKSLPPMISPADMSWYLPTFLRVSYIWYASSRVGVMIRAPRPSSRVHCLQYNISITGMRNARVFPLPVLAAPKMSCPFNAKPMLCLWMSVRSTYSLSFSPFRVWVDNGKSENFLICDSLI